jgi:uncharacterized protein
MSAARNDSSTIVLDQVQPGTRRVFRLPVTTDLDGGEVAVWVHALRGVRPGPTLTLIGVQHGDEWKGLEILRQAVEQIDPASINGTVLVVPVANPVAFGNGQRNTQPESDWPDMNRAWPGIHTWLAESITKVIDREVLAQSDVLLDFHPGMWGSAFYAVLYGADYPDRELAQRCHNLGVAFGHRCLGKGKLIQVFPGPRSMRAHAGMKYGIPSLVVEIGGAGFGLEREQGWTNDALRGIRNVMRHLEMIDGEPLEKPERMLIYEHTARVNPTVGGLLLPERDPDELLREVRAGELLGRMVSPYTFEELERLVAPVDGWLYYIARSYTLRPGHWAYGVIAREGAEWITP